MRESLEHAIQRYPGRRVIDAFTARYHQTQAKKVQRSTGEGGARQGLGTVISALAIDPTLVIRWLTIAALASLLLGVGLRLTWAEVVSALKRSRLTAVLALNFVGIPLLAIALARLFQVGRDQTIGMILLAAAPFAPVVPVFARMARADLALAAGLTALFPFFSAVLSPFVCAISLKVVPGTEGIRFDFLSVLGVLLATISLPLAAGLAFNQWRPAWAKAAMRPVEVLGEVTGSASLLFVAVAEFKTALATGWQPMLVMVLVSELAFLAGYMVIGSSTAARRVIALGTSNRNIALAVLLAINNFPHTPVVGAVVANGFLLILLGLLHVAWWRLLAPIGPPAPGGETA